MGLFSKLFGSENNDALAGTRPEHHLVVHVRLAEDVTGREAERAEMEELTRLLGESIGGEGCGRLISAGISEGDYVVHFVGSDAEKMWERALPVLECRPCRKGSKVLKIFGLPGQAAEDRVNLHWDG